MEYLECARYPVCKEQLCDGIVHPSTARALLQAIATSAYLSVL